MGAIAEVVNIIKIYYRKLPSSIETTFLIIFLCTIKVIVKIFLMSGYTFEYGGRAYKYGESEVEANVLVHIHRCGADL